MWFLPLPQEREGMWPLALAYLASLIDHVGTFLDSSNCFARLPKNTLPVSIISIHSFMLSFLLFLFKITRQRGSNFWEWIYFRQGLASEGSLSICCCCCFCLFHVPFSQLFQTPNVKQYPTMMEGFASCIRYAIRCPMEAMVAVRN